MPEQDVLAVDEASVKLFPLAKAAYVIHIRESMKKFVMPTRSAQVAATKTSLIKAPSNARPTSIAASSIPSRLRQPTKISASFPPSPATRRTSNGDVPTTPTSTTPVNIVTNPTTKPSAPPPPLTVSSPVPTITPTPTALSPAPGNRRRAPPMPRTWSSPTSSSAALTGPSSAGTPITDSKPESPSDTLPQKDTTAIVLDILPPLSLSAPAEASSPASLIHTAEPTPPVVEEKPSSLETDAKGEDAVGPNADAVEPEINVWDIDDMCVVQAPVSAAPQQSLLEKMKDVTVNEELLRIAEYALLDIIVVTNPEMKKVQGILKNIDTYQKPPEGIRFSEQVSEMEHFMYEQEEFERDEEEERKRIERLSRYSSDEEDDYYEETPPFMTEEKDEEDEGDDREVSKSEEKDDEGTDDDSGKGGESALEAWKRAMEEKTEKLRQASVMPPGPTEHGEDGKRTFRVQPRAWGNASTSIVVDAPEREHESSSAVGTPSSALEDLKSDHESENEHEEVVKAEKPHHHAVKIASKRKVLIDRTKKGNTLGKGFVLPSPSASDDEGEHSGESALDAWKRAMEEKTQKLKLASATVAHSSSASVPSSTDSTFSNEHGLQSPSDGQRKFRVQPRTWGSNSSNPGATS